MSGFSNDASGNRGDRAAADGPVLLARQPEFRLGPMQCQPSTRQCIVDGRAETAEPRVMQLLVALAQRRGVVVPRDELVERCWQGRAVSDDAINRCIAKVRRMGEATGAFVVETIPRVGYRLVPATGPGVAGDPVRDRPGGEEPGRFVDVGRRALVGAAVVATVAAAGGIAIHFLSGDPPNPRVAELMEQGRQALREELPDSDQQGVAFLRDAVALEPGNAQAWGLLALALRNVVENAPPSETSAAVRACERAARRALSLDPREGNALAALAGLRPIFGDWIAAEDRLRAVLAVAPDNVAAIGELVMLLQSVGRCRDSWNWNERAASLDPLSPVPQYRRALKHWIFGRVSQADLTIDRALQLWPRHPGVWNARLQIFAFTGRARAGLLMIEDQGSRPPTFSRRAHDLWRTSLVALESRAPPDIEAARRANLESAPRSPGFANNAVMILSLLGDADAALAVAEGYFLRRGPLVGTLWTGDGQMPVNDQRWRRTMILFTPAAAALRAHPRFPSLCGGIGLADYWRRRAIRPDFPVG